MAAYGDYILFADENKNRVLLNIGGIANFTYLPAGAAMNDIVCTDTGPGNTLMDAYIQKHFPGKYFDKDAELAKSGNIHEGLLEALLNHTFFALPFPKTTGPELFNLNYFINAQKQSNTENISSADCMATLNAFTARSIALAIEKNVIGNPVIEIFISGGGAHNPLLISTLKKLLPVAKIESSSLLNINPDAKEAILFALLANECICTNHQFTEGSRFPNVSMGKISFPA